MKRKLAVYVHIPFCIKKCAYCDFLSAPAAGEVQERYVKALQCEIRSRTGFLRRTDSHTGRYGEAFDASQDQCGISAGAQDDREVCSVFFGGGTPSILEAGRIADILETLRERFSFAADAELTVECNPGTLTREKLFSYRQAGVNRLSIGLQSANNRELRLLGRIHTWEDFLSGYRLARQAGFDNINVDLMSALPGQTPASYEETLRRVAALRPEHISAYSLMIEEGTPFYEMYGPEGRRGEKEAPGKAVPAQGEERENGNISARKEESEAGSAPLPDEDTERAMYARTQEVLREAGYHRYEISNYALEGRECRHNICYWERTEYIGFGLGAASLFGERRWSNERELLSYIKAAEQGQDVRREIEPLSENARMEEFMFLGMRMMRGVSRGEFRRQFGKSIEQVYGGVLEKYRRLGLLDGDGDRIFLTARGIDVSNMIFCDFMLEDADEGGGSAGRG